MSHEKVNLKKFTTGFVQPVEWWKAASTGIKIAVLVLIAFFVWRFFFVKTQTQKTQIGRVEGDVNIVQKPSRFFIPFVEGGVEKNSDTALDTYIRAGLRFEFY